jgi:RNA polymerase sigma factor (sigma-70 family)
MTDNVAIDEHDEPGPGEGDDAPPEAVPPDRADDAALVVRAQAGDPDAFGRLYDRWIDRVHALARRVVRDPDAAEEVAQDAFLSAWRSLGGLQDPNAFGGWLLRITRNAAFDRLGREGRSRPVDDEVLAVIEQGGATAGAGAPEGFDLETRLGRLADPAAAASDREIVALVHEAAAALGERDAEVLDLQLRYDLGPAEIGEVIGLNRNAANQLCHRVRGRFATAFRARMLWHGGQPSCPGLATAFADAGVTTFGADAVSVTERHLRTCAECDGRSRTLVQPAALFGALPLLAAPVALKARVASGLTAHGVPMGGSSAATAGTGGAGTGPQNGPNGAGGQGGVAPTSPPAGQPVVPGAPAPAVEAVPLVTTAARARTASSAPRRRLVAAGAVAAVAVIGIGALLLGRSFADDDEAVATDVEVAVVGTAPSTTPAGTSPTDGSSPTSPAAPSSSPPTTAPAVTTTIAPTTTTVAPPTIAQLTLSTDAWSTPWPLATGPTLAWRVDGATGVKVWLMTYDGGGVARRTSVVSTSPTGQLQVCPGPVVAGSCQSPTGTYAFEIEATGPGGTTLTSPGSRPVLVVSPVIY